MPMSTADYLVEREEANGSGRYFIRLDADNVAEMTYRQIAPQVVAIDHTFVPRAFRGGGVAEQLVETGIANARAEGVRIMPVCSYVAAQFRRHPEWQDLRA